MPLRVMETYAAAMPRVSAQRVLDAMYATSLANGGKEVAEHVATLRRVASGGDATPVTTGPATLALLHAANERARARGELYEQRVSVPRGTTAPHEGT